MAAKNTNQGALCPACERFIGPLDTCPYCDAPSPKPFSLRFLRIASIVLAVIGMALLYVTARQGRLPAVDISAVTPAMNSAYVRVSGFVVASPRTGRDGTGYVTIPVSDGSNRLTVVAYGRCACALIDATNVPQRGVKVEVAGVVSITRPGEKRIILESPDQLTVLACAPGRSAGAVAGGTEQGPAARAGRDSLSRR